MRLIDADLLYERACSLEAQALDYVGKLIERDGDKASVEWKIWSAVLMERTAFKHDVFDAPTVEERQWIPCSEGLPSKQGQYLVTFPLCNGEPWVYVLSFCKGKFYETDDEWGYVEYEDVTAWMPLPEPWKGGGHGR